jgi:Na+/melibiose symporter-like transporter
LKEGTFYIHGLVYMMVRIAVNVTMTVQPFYVVNVTRFEVTESNPSPYQLALVPLLSYITSLVFSLFIQQRMTRTLKNRMLPMLVAIVIITSSSLPLIFLTGDPSIRWLIYPLAAL